MKLLSYFKHFLENTVNLNEARIDQLDSRVEAISDSLSGDTELAPLVLAVIPQGSYAHKTIIRPLPDHEFDADILLQLEEQADWEPQDYVQNVYAAFRRSSTYKEMVGRRTRCVVVDYANEFHVDVVPYLVRDPGRYITNRKENRFELTNPEGFNEWLDDQNRVAGGHLVEVIRLVKFLRDFKGTFGVKSVILTTLLGNAVNFANVLGDADYYCDMPTALRNVVSDLDRYLQENPHLPVIADPSCPTEDFNHRWDQDGYANFRSKIHGYAAKIDAAYIEADRDASITLWQEIFGDDFKKPPAAATLAKAAAPAGTDTERFIERDFGFPFASQRYRLRIVGRVGPKPGFRTYDLPSQGNRVHKGRSLRFRIAACDVPAPYEVYWKIKNTGEEATRVNQLRGEIVEDAGSHQRSETTKYRGSHYVECYIVKDRRVVAVDRQPVFVI
jgi:hypothetical protein